MELKMKYNYSYFIYPYVIKESRYNRYIQGMLKSTKYTPRYFQRKKDLNIYNFFLPNIRDYMFKSFGFVDKKAKEVHSLEDKLRENMFKDSPCVMFEYNIGDDAQAKAGDEDGIFFKIEKLEIICFKTGICFLIMKTNVEDTDRFADLLNFNLKFRDINSEVNGCDIYSNIKIQSDTFADIKRLSDIIREITGSTVGTKKIDIDVNRFLVYSYACIDQEYWNDNKPFADIEKEFFKFANVLNSEFNSSYENARLRVVDFGRYIKLGISKAGLSLITSSARTVNYTNLLYEFENEYLYTYIFALYEKFYLSKLISDFQGIKKYSKAAKDFVDFTNDIWVHEITNSDNGTLIFENAKTAIELNKKYEIAKEQYDVAYKNFKMKNNDILNKIVLILLAASIITNIVNFINLYNLK